MRVALFRILRVLNWEGNELCHSRPKNQSAGGVGGECGANDGDGEGAEAGVKAVGLGLHSGPSSGVDPGATLRREKSTSFHLGVRPLHRNALRRYSPFGRTRELHPAARR